MLTYALVDRGTVVITGLERQTDDKAWFQGQYYSDKLPGFSLLATLPYCLAKWALRLPNHPLDVDALPYWAADYWVTLGTSGLLTAAYRRIAGASGRATWAAAPSGRRSSAWPMDWRRRHTSMPRSPTATRRRRLHCSRRSSCSGRRNARATHSGVFVAGFLAAYAAVIELQVGPVSAILGLLPSGPVSATASGGPTALSLFAIGASIPTLILLTYNQLAFGSPWDMGYFHHATNSSPTSTTPTIRWA